MKRLLFTAKRKDGKGHVLCGSIIQFYDDGVLTAYMPDFNSKCDVKHEHESGDLIGIESCRFHEIDPETIFVGPPTTFAQVHCDFTSGLKHRYTQLVVENTKLRRRIRELEKFESVKFRPGQSIWILAEDQDKNVTVEECVVGNVDYHEDILGTIHVVYRVGGLTSDGIGLCGVFDNDALNKCIFFSEEAAKKHLPKKGETENARK